LTISGAMKGGVPLMPVTGAWESATTRDKPKSHNLTMSCGPLHMKLSGLTSRWTTPRLCTKAKPASMPRKNLRKVSSFKAGAAAKVS